MYLRYMMWWWYRQSAMFATIVANFGATTMTLSTYQKKTLDEEWNGGSTSEKSPRNILSLSIIFRLVVV